MTQRKLSYSLCCWWAAVCLLVLEVGVAMRKVFVQSATATGSLSGELTDVRGARVIGAFVPLIETRTNTIRSSASN